MRHDYKSFLQNLNEQNWSGEDFSCVVDFDLWVQEAVPFGWDGETACAECLGPESSAWQLFNQWFILPSGEGMCSCCCNQVEDFIVISSQVSPLDEGGCPEEVDPILGCTDQSASNYDSEADTDDGSCVYPVYGCTDPSAFNYDPNADELGDSLCCLDSTSSNWVQTCSYDCPNMSDTQEIEEFEQYCFCCDHIIFGCTNNIMSNYNPEANVDDGTCDYGWSCANFNEVQAQDTEFAALAFNYQACQYWNMVDNTSMEMINYLVLYPYTFDTDMSGYGDDGYAANNGFSVPAYTNEGECCTNLPDLPTIGCTDPIALNYGDYDMACYSLGDVDDNIGSLIDNYQACSGVPEGTENCCCFYQPGCMDPEASNYNPDALVDGGNCEYVEGCTDPEALNYNPDAVIDNGICMFWEDICTSPTSTWGTIDPSGQQYMCNAFFMYEEDPVQFPNFSYIENTIVMGPNQECCDFINVDELTTIYGCTDPAAINYGEAYMNVWGPYNLAANEPADWMCEYPDCSKVYDMSEAQQWKFCNKCEQDIGVGPIMGPYGSISSAYCDCCGQINIDPEEEDDKDKGALVGWGCLEQSPLVQMTGKFCLPFTPDIVIPPQFEINLEDIELYPSKEECASSTSCYSGTYAGSNQFLLSLPWPEVSEGIKNLQIRAGIKK